VATGRGSRPQRALGRIVYAKCRSLGGTVVGAGRRRRSVPRVGLIGRLALAAAAAYYVAMSLATGSPLGAHIIHAAALSAGGLVVDAARQKAIAVDDETVILFDTSGIDERDREILRALTEAGPMGVSELARKLGLSKSVVSRKLRKLAEMGLVEKKVVDGRPVYTAKTG